MNDCTILARQLHREAAATGARAYDGYYLFDGDEERYENWPMRDDIDDVLDLFCLDCAKQRIAEARAAGVLIRDDLDWGHPDRYSAYDGPFNAYGQEHDTVAFCADCYRVLDFNPTDYCIENELQGFQYNDRGCRASADDLLVLSQLLDGADNTKYAAELVAVARDTLSLFFVPPEVELRRRIPTWAKVRSAWAARKKELRRLEWAEFGEEA